MVLPTDFDLLSFDPTRFGWDDHSTSQLYMRQYPELYRNHLEVALWTERHRRLWVDRQNDPEYRAGFAVALEEVAANLREGLLLPDGFLLDPDGERTAPPDPGVDATEPPRPRP